MLSVNLKSTLLRALVGAAASILSTGAAAGELTLRFEINPQINGSRPWDGTGLKSSSIDGGDKENKNPITGLIGGVVGQALVDQANDRMAPPDPYVCLILDASGKLRCGRAQKDTIRLEVAIPAQAANRKWFGVVLLDSDAGNPFGGQDDLIGYGVMLDEPTLAAVRAGDASARRTAAVALATVTRVVKSKFGTNRSLMGPLGGGRLDAAKLSMVKCESGCAMGDAKVFTTTSVDGW